MGYDDQFIYFALHITDDVHVQSHPANELWKSDSLQLAIGSKTLIRGDEFAIALSNGVVTRAHYTAEKSLLSAHDLDHVIPSAIKRNETAKTTSYKVAIFRSFIGQSNEFIFTFLINDDDGRGREGWYELTLGIGAGKDPKQWKAAILN